MESNNPGPRCRWTSIARQSRLWSNNELAHSWDALNCPLAFLCGLCDLLVKNVFAFFESSENLLLPHQRARVRDSGDEGEDLRGVDRGVGRGGAVDVEFRLVGPFFVQEKQRRVVV